MRVICEHCEHCIKDGVIAIHDADGDGYPAEPSPELDGLLQVELRDRYGDRIGHSLREIHDCMDEIEADNPPRIVLEFTHHDCYSRDGKPGYWITVDQDLTALKMIGWLAHLGDKRWWGSRDAQTMMARILDQNPEGR